jgi:hypothetical protein
MRVRSVAMKAELPELLLDRMQIFTMMGSSILFEESLPGAYRRLGEEFTYSPGIFIPD